jgi:cathepsin D
MRQLTSSAVLATQTSDNLLTGDNTGIIGLAFESIASTQAVPLWQALQQGGNLAQPYLSFFLERLKDDTNAPADNAFGGVFTLGGTNQSFYTGDIDFQPFPSGTQQSFWLQTVKAVTVNGNSVSLAGGDAELAAIDTGTTLIGGPSSDVAAVWKQVQGSAAVTSGDYVGFYSFRGWRPFPCGMLGTDVGDSQRAPRRSPSPSTSAARRGRSRPTT